jgi:hypothetical protein
MNMAVAVELDTAAANQTIRRVGDAMLWAWGEARKNGWLERLLLASVAAIQEDGTPRAPGTHSDPTLARLMACEVEEEFESKKNRAAFLVECEMAHWRKDRHLMLWAKVAQEYYAGPHLRTNEEVGHLLKISERTVEGIRSQMRRMLFMASNRR